METKYRSVNEIKAQICELLTSRREQPCSKYWFRNKDRCYYASTFEASFRKAVHECSNRYSRLLRINSWDEARFIFRSPIPRNITYWVGKCDSRNGGFDLLYMVPSGRSSCSECKPNRRGEHCIFHQHHFICEKSAPYSPDIPEKIQVLCQQPGEPT
ncbi:C-type lectin domain family 4 member E-like [Hemitrygon akajei]|uniref:C-type lectin domain family 4 member E-like n=1 Tax=Hemitrygon akajei TaxID=2704970 RepID=UPI003BF9F363